MIVCFGTYVADVNISDHDPGECKKPSTKVVDMLERLWSNKDMKGRQRVHTMNIRQLSNNARFSIIAQPGSSIECHGVSYLHTPDPSITRTDNAILSRRRSLFLTMCTLGCQRNGPARVSTLREYKSRL